MSEQISALCCHLCPQLYKPPHPIAPLVLASHSLGNALVHTAVAAPTFIAIAAPPPLPLPPPPQGQHAATHPAHRLAMMHTGAPRCAGRRHGVMEKGLGGERHRHFREKRVCSPSWAAPAPFNLELKHFIVYIIVLLTNTIQMMYTMYYEGERDRACSLSEMASSACETMSSHCQMLPEVQEDVEIDTQLNSLSWP